MCRFNDAFELVWAFEIPDTDIADGYGVTAHTCTPSPQMVQGRTGDKKIELYINNLKSVA